MWRNVCVRLYDVFVLMTIWSGVCVRLHHVCGGMYVWEDCVSVSVFFYCLPSGWRSVLITRGERPDVSQLSLSLSHSLPHLSLSLSPPLTLISLTSLSLPPSPSLTHLIYVFLNPVLRPKIGTMAINSHINAVIVEPLARSGLLKPPMAKSCFCIETGAVGLCTSYTLREINGPSSLLLHLWVLLFKMNRFVKNCICATHLCR